VAERRLMDGDEDDAVEKERKKAEGRKEVIWTKQRKEGGEWKEQQEDGEQSGEEPRVYRQRQ